MHLKNSTLLLGIALAACSTSVPQKQVSDESDSSSVVMIYEESSASSMQTIPLDEALDATFSSDKLGIALRYPSTAVIGGCPSVAITVKETDTSIQFIPEPMPDVSCASIGGDGVFNVVYAQRVTDEEGVAAFISKVFSPDCVIGEQSEFQENGDDYSMVFSISRNPPSDAPDFCSEAVRWNRTAGVVVFSSLGSKTGGAPDWPSNRQILLPDGIIEYSYDYPIMLSIRYLKP